MPDAALSGQLHRGLTAADEEEKRARLQERLAVFSKALFASFVALVALMFVLYTLDPTIEPDNQEIIYGIATLALAILAFLWRVVLARGTRSLVMLYRIDSLITVGSGFVFGMVAPLAYELEAAAYTCLLYESFVVFTRALLIPCSKQRTLVVSSLAFAPIVAGSVVLAWLDWKGIAHLRIGGVAFVIGDLVYNAVAVLLATTGTRIIYDLRLEVDRAKHAGKLGQYTIGERIGGGGMGQVFRATHALLRRETAIKVVIPDKASPKAFDLFETEVQAMSRLTHPNTVAVFDYGRSLEGQLYYAMEYLEGVDLHRLVTAHGGAQPAGRVIQILQQVCGALHEAHTKHTPHRDIKPANIILCVERGGVPDVAKVVDFGLVGTAGDATKHVHGTPAFLAPEAVTDLNPSGELLDLYALGAVGYFLLTGHPVFSGTPAELVAAHMSKAPRPLAEVTTNPVPPALEAVILKCLAKLPQDRYPSAAALAEALGAIQTDDWDRARATAWWADWGNKNEARKRPPPSVDARTVTLAIELGDRAAQPGLTGHEK